VRLLRPRARVRRTRGSRSGIPVPTDSPAHRMFRLYATRSGPLMIIEACITVASPAFSWPVSSSAPMTRASLRRPRCAASSRPAAANRRTSLIAASVSHDARFSSRCVRSGPWSPACWAIVHPFRFGISLSSADTYLPACCQVCARAKHGRSRSSSSARFRLARPAPILAAAAAFDSFVLTST